MIQEQHSSKKTFSGLQTLDRAVDILGSVANRILQGAKLVEVVADCGLSRATTHRLLQALVVANLLEQDKSDLRYYVGVKLAHFSEAAGQRFGLERMTLTARKRIADATGDTVFLTVRTGMRMICTARTEGGYPVKVLTLDVGSARPLGVGSGGLAILSALSHTQCKKIVSTLSSQYEAFNLSAREVLRLTDLGRRLGYCVDHDTVLHGVTGVSVPLVGIHGKVFGSLGIAAISTRMTEARVMDVAKILIEEATLIIAEKQLFDETDWNREHYNKSN